MATNTELLRDTTLDKGGSSADLVVLLHGLGGALGDCHKAIRSALPNADIWAPSYPSSVLSSADPYRIAQEVDSWIEELLEKREVGVGHNEGYQRIYLVGFSGGGAVLRRAYLIGTGIGDRDSALPRYKPKRWPALVNRIVLLAGINRGISDEKPDEMGVLRYLAIRSGLSLLRLFEILQLDAGRYVSSLRRGSSFISNLRLDWIEACRNGEIPSLIQLLGDRDDIVALEDNIDVLSDGKAIYVQVLNSSHETLATFFDNTRAGAERKERFISAMIEDEPEGQMLPSKMQSDEAISDVVFVLHGIRDRGEWTGVVEDKLKEVGGHNGRKVKVINSSYGYFPMIRFLLFAARQSNVRWFVDQYVESIYKYPNAIRSFIGHSNGTYLLAAALKKYSAFRFENVYFAGSVVPTSFDWDKYIDAGRVKAVRSDTATADWVVAWFPAFYEFLGISDLGSAGFNGFRANEARNYLYRFRGDHGAAIKKVNHISIASYIFFGDKGEAPPREALSEKANPFVEFFSKNCWFVWLFIVASLWLFGARLVIPFLVTLGVPAFAGVGAYIFLLALLMYCL